MTPPVTRKRFAFLATDGVEEATLLDPWRVLAAAGGEPELVSPGSGNIRAMRGMELVGERVPDVRLSEDPRPESYTALVLPGGLISVDRLRVDEAAVAFVRGFFAAARPVAAIGHAPWLLVEAEVVNGQRVTGAPSLRTDLVNAGALWSDEPVVVHRSLVTCRGPEHLAAFSAEVRREVAAGVHPEDSRRVTAQREEAPS